VSEHCFVCCGGRAAVSCTYTCRDAICTPHGASVKSPRPCHSSSCSSRDTLFPHLDAPVALTLPAFSADTWERTWWCRRAKRSPTASQLLRPRFARNAPQVYCVRVVCADPCLGGVGHKLHARERERNHTALQRGSSTLVGQHCSRLWPNTCHNSCTAGTLCVLQLKAPSPYVPSALSPAAHRCTSAPRS
jgi:hypothetical protein